MRLSGRSRARIRLAVLVVIASLFVPAVAAARDPAADGEPPSLQPPGSDLLARDSWIVTLAAGVATSEAPGLARAAGGEVGLVYTHAFDGFQFKGSARAAEALRHNPRVASVYADHPVYLTETLPYGVQRVDGYVPGGSGAYQAGYRGNGARIAILDTGIDLDHPDLSASVDPSSGKNCVFEGDPNDGYGHGTHVAGTAAAPLNGVGVVGVAPEAQLVAVKVFDDSGNSAESIVLCGLDHITGLNTDADPANDIDVANMSWGEQRAWGDCFNDPLHRVICAAHAANIKLVGGAGNSAVSGSTFVPAAFSEVYSTSALADFDGDPGGSAGCGFVPALFWIECDDTLAFFSNTVGVQDFIAPGVNVYSTWVGGGYSTQSGTSMATPHVTGIVALLAALDHTLSPAAVRDVLLTSGECPNGQWADADGVPGCAGQGTWPDDPDGATETLPNALRAAELVTGGSPPPPPPPPPTPEEPGAPVLNSATGGVGSVALAWSAPASDGGSPITGYEVWRGTSPGAETLLTTVGVQTSYTDTTVAAGTIYWYQVAAVNAVGSGPRSNELSASSVQVPSAPTLLGAPADNAVALSWTVPADDGGAPIIGYSVHRRVGSGPESLLATTDGSTTTYVDFAVSNGTSYTYRVTAGNAAGEGAFSNPVMVVPTGSATAPGAPQNLDAAKAKGGSFAVELSWSAPASDGGSPISTYFVYRRGPGESGFSFLGNTADGATTSFTDATVERRTAYTYYVTAWNAYGPSPPSNEATVRSK